jgi:short-subunit dehydrogenase
MRPGRGQTALITGASSGIGLELARRFAADGYDLVLVALPGGAIETIAEEIARTFGARVTPIACDLGEPNAVQDLVRRLDQCSLTIDVLVNNAGFGAAGPFEAIAADTQPGIIDVNIRALVELTHVLWPRILRARRGGVLNVASVMAFQPGPFMAIYCASKAFVLSFSQALWEEARKTGVHVTCLCPGVTETPFHARAGTNRLRVTRRGMSAAQVADIGYRAFQANKRVKVTGVADAAMARLVAILPGRWVLRRVRRLLRAEVKTRQ